MGKLENMYKDLKIKDSNYLYLFKSGFFYIFIADDALMINDLFGLKLTHLNNDILKCGFPINALEKYITIFKKKKLKIKIIDSNDYVLVDAKVKKVLAKIKDVDINNISGINALNLLDELKGKYGRFNDI